MMGQDPRTEPRNAHIGDSDIGVPYGTRSVKKVFGFLIFLFIAGMLISWYFFTPSAVEQAADSVSATVSSVAAVGEKGQQVPQSQPMTQSTAQPAASNGNAPASQNEGEGAIHNFVESLVSGAKDGIAKNDPAPYNFDTSDSSAGAVNSTMDAMVAMEQNKNRFANLDDGYRHSLNDVLGSEIRGSDGSVAGELHDVIIDIQTGKAQAIIVDKESAYYDRDLTALTFKAIATQEEDGDVRANITDDQIDQRRKFDYATLNQDQYVSLKDLREGQILDFENKVVGQVQAVIYENASANQIFFALQPSMVPAGKARVYGMSYTEMNVVKNPDGFDIKLSKDQTEELAKLLYEK